METGLWSQARSHLANSEVYKIPPLLAQIQNKEDRRLMFDYVVEGMSKRDEGCFCVMAAVHDIHNKKLRKRASSYCSSTLQSFVVHANIHMVPVRDGESTDLNYIEVRMDGMPRHAWYRGLTLSALGWLFDRAPVLVLNVRHDGATTRPYSGQWLYRMGEFIAARYPHPPLQEVDKGTGEQFMTAYHRLCRYYNHRHVKSHGTHAEGWFRRKVVIVTGDPARSMVTEGTIGHHLSWAKPLSLTLLPYSYETFREAHFVMPGAMPRPTFTFDQGVSLEVDDKYTGSAIDLGFTSDDTPFQGVDFSTKGKVYYDDKRAIARKLDPVYEKLQRMEVIHGL